MPASRRRPSDRWARLHRATSLLVGDDGRLAAHADQVRELLGAFDPEVVLDYWSRERVLVLAVERAESIGLRDASWEEAADELRAFAGRRAGLVDLVGLRVSRALEAGGVTPVVLKGPQLAERIHGGAARRAPSADIDILVPTAALFDAQDLLMAIGWERATDPLLANGLPIHHLTLPGPTGAPNVELHWRVQWYDDASHAEGLFARATDYRGLRVPDPVDLLGLLLLCWSRDGFHSLRLAADIAAWWRTYGVDEAEHANRLWELGTLLRPLTIAARAAHSVVGTPAPPSVPSDRAARLAVRIAETDRPRSRRPGGPTQRALVDILTCPVEQRRERFFTTWALPPSVSRFAHPWAPRWLVPLLRAGSAARTAVEAAPIAWRARRPSLRRSPTPRAPKRAAPKGGR